MSKSLETVGHLISWVIFASVPICASLVLAGMLPHFFGDLGAITDVFLTILIFVFIHGIVQVWREMNSVR